MLIVHGSSLNQYTRLDVLNQFDELIGGEMCSFIADAKRDHVAFLACSLLTVNCVLPAQIFLIPLQW